MRVGIVPRSTNRIEYSDKYKHVYKYSKCNGAIVRYETDITGQRISFVEERDCAKFVDIELIKQGLEPVNILKRI